MKKLVSIVLALALVAALFVPTCVNAEDTSVKLTIDENFDVNSFGKNPVITTTELVQKEGKWALKYSQLQDQTDPYYALPNSYRDSFNGDYHFAVWDVYYEPDADSIGTILSYRLNYAQDTDANVWMQRHVILFPQQGGQWIKVLFDMTNALTNPLQNTSYECWSASGTGTPYADGAKFNDSRVYFSTVANGNVGDQYYLHEIAMFKTKAEAYAYMGKEVHQKTGNVLDENAQVYWYSSANNPGGVYNFADAASTGFKFTVPEGKYAEQFAFNSPTWCNVDTIGSDISADLYKWEGDYASSVAAAPIASTNVYGHTDCTWLVIEYDENIPAGDYLMVIKAIGEYCVGVWQADGVGDSDSLIFVGDNPVPNWYASFVAMLVDPLNQITDANGFYLPEDAKPNATTEFTDKAGTDIKFRSWTALSREANGFAYTVDGGAFQTEGLAMNLLPDGDGWRTGIAAAVGDGYPVIYEYSLTGLKMKSGTHTYKIYALNGNRYVELASFEIKDTETAPQTGDMTVAMFAVVAVVALAAIVVLKKRVHC